MQSKLAATFACTTERGREIGILVAGAKVHWAVAGHGRAEEDSKGASWVGEGW